MLRSDLHHLNMEIASSNARSTYSRTAIALHWIIALLVLTTIPLGVYGATFETELGQAATNTHKSIGILILAFSLVRLGWRLTHRPPPLPTQMTPALRMIARISHTLFYVLLLVLPLSGWWMSSAVPERHPFGFGLFEVPFLPVPRGFAWAGPAFLIHTALGFLMIGLVALHIAAALKHHFFDKDDVLGRMLTRRS
jgi:cytochrome b561